MAHDTVTRDQGPRLSTADLLRSAKARDDVGTDAAEGDARDAREAGRDETLVELFESDVAQRFRARWDEVQIGFVDDPTQSVRRADELVAEVMTRLAETFARERSQLEGVVQKADDAASTEDLRVALRRYRSFFQRLLSL
jgi:hypothetical protein